MTVTRKEPTALGFSRAVIAALKPGPHGTPVIDQEFGKTDDKIAGFVVRASETGETYRVTFEQTAPATSQDPA